METPQKESDKKPIVSEMKKKTGRKKQSHRVKFEVVHTPVVLEFK